MENLKKEIYLYYIRELQEKLRIAKIGYETARYDTIEAEGRMVTRYDSTKTEVAWLADGYLKEVKGIEKYLDFLSKVEKMSNISDVVTVDIIDDSIKKDTKKYALCCENIDNSESLGAGNSILLDLIGCSIGDIVKSESDAKINTYQITKIQKGNPIDIIGIHNLIELEDEFGFIDYYYIVVDHGGVEKTLDDGSIVYYLSKNTPLARALIGNRIGSKVSIFINEKINFTIKGIW